MSSLEEIVLPHLHTQFERGRVVLFTGAGFSLTTKNILGSPLPSSKGLAETIWPLCFPSVSFDDSSSLQDLYETALAKNPTELARVLTQSLTVMPASVEDWLVDYYLMPWHRIYTLNIDNLAQVIAQRFSLPRQLDEISATNLSWAKPKIEGLATPLEVVYLNGMLTDIPDKVTFAATQYARRLAFPDSFYQELTAEIVSRPVIFVGTRLDEPSLWQNIEIRKNKGPRGVNELRPRSYLVTPTLDRARESRLAEFNITWIPMTAYEFSTQVLKQLSGAREAGFKVFGAHKAKAGSKMLEEVSDLATAPHTQSEFLLGQEPIWADIQSGRAIERVSDKEFWVCFSSVLSGRDVRGIIVLAGTAGSGKSASLMRLALNAMAANHKVAWVDRSNDLSKREIIAAMRSDKPPTVLMIDDADLLGSGLSMMIKDILSSEHNPLVVMAIRSGVIDRVINPTVLAGIPIRELSVPLLDDADIDLLIATLDRENRLGRLKGKTIDQQRQIFRESAGRQLLVAMLHATSGEKLEVKIPNEFFELTPDAQRVYAVVALATTFRYRLTKQDILTALNDSRNELLNSIELLLRRHILVEMPPGSSMIQVRHRMVADLVRDALQKSGQLQDAVSGLAFMAATHVTPRGKRNDRSHKLLRSVINHEFLYRTLGRDLSQALYQQLEVLLNWEPHYWLQRGSMEVEYGDVRLAENFLGQARGLSPDNLLIENEWAYLLFRRALVNPAATGAQDLVREATEIAIRLTESNYANQHPFHVLGSQGLAWSRVGMSGRTQKEPYLRGLVTQVEKGLNRFPKSLDLKQLRDDLKREYLSLALPSVEP